MIKSTDEYVFLIDIRKLNMIIECSHSVHYQNLKNEFSAWKKFSFKQFVIKSSVYLGAEKCPYPTTKKLCPSMCHDCTESSGFSNTISA